MSIKRIISFYEGESPSVKLQLVRILSHGFLANTGKLIIYPVDQGFEHGPIMAFHKNTDAMDPHYHYKIAINAGFSAYAAPIGLLESGIESFLGKIPIILKLNSNNLLSGLYNQALTSSVDDALRLGCVGVGYTIYPGANSSLDMIEEAREVIKEARSKGMFSVVWSYPRGENLKKEDESSLDVVAYGAHIASLLGAHIIKVKIPTEQISSYGKDYIDGFLENSSNNIFDKIRLPEAVKLSERIRLIIQSCFNGRRLVVFSGGEKKNEENVLKEAESVIEGGGNGLIIGRNCFQRPYNEALMFLDKVKNTLLSSKSSFN